MFLKLAGYIYWQLISELTDLYKNLSSGFLKNAKKLRFKIVRKRSHRICPNFDIIEAIMAGTNSLKRFLKKTPGTEKHKDK